MTLRRFGVGWMPPEDRAYGHRNAGVVVANGINWWIGAPVK